MVYLGCWVRGAWCWLFAARYLILRSNPQRGTNSVNLKSIVVFKWPQRNKSTHPRPLSASQLHFIHIFSVPYILLMINSPPSPLYFVKRGVHVIKFQKWWLRFYHLGLGVFPSWNNSVKVLFDFLGMIHKFQHINELPPLYEVERGSGGWVLKS